MNHPPHPEGSQALVRVTLYGTRTADGRIDPVCVDLTTDGVGLDHADVEKAAGWLDRLADTLRQEAPALVALDAMEAGK